MKTRIANAKIDPTFLLTDVKIVVTYKLANVNRMKLESLIHRIFDPARLDIEIKDHFSTQLFLGNGFSCPRFVIDRAIEKVKDGIISI